MKAPFARLRKQVTKAALEAKTSVLVINGGEAEIHFEFGSPVYAALATEGSISKGLRALEELTGCVSLPVKISWMPPFTVDFNLDELEEKELLKLLADPKSDREEPDEDETIKKALPKLKFFPLLPQGKALVASTPADFLPLSDLIVSLPTSLIVLTSEEFRAAAIVFEGTIVEALYVSSGEKIMGRAAAKALLESPKGVFSVYALEEALVPAIEALWRMPVKYPELKSSWLNTEEFLGDLLNLPGDRAILLNNKERWGVVIIIDGAIRCSYTTEEMEPTASMEGFYSILEGESEKLITVIEGYPSEGEEVGEELFHEKANQEAEEPQGKVQERLDWPTFTEESPETSDESSKDTESEGKWPFTPDFFDIYPKAEEQSEDTNPEEESVEKKEFEEDIQITPAEEEESAEPSDAFDFPTEQNEQQRDEEKVYSPLLDDAFEPDEGFVSQVSVDWDLLLKELCNMAEKLLGPGPAQAVIDELLQARRSPTGLRIAYFL